MTTASKVSAGKEKGMEKMQRARYTLEYKLELGIVKKAAACVL